MEPEKDIFNQWAEERDAMPWYKKIASSISSNWKFKYQYLWRDFKVGVKNIWYWLPIIWKDRNWDQGYIFTILKHKLEAQANCIGTRDIHTRAKRDAEVMMTCVRLIDKVGEEFYSLEYSDYHKTKHWFEPADKEGYSNWKSKLLEENFDDYFAKYPLIYKRVMNGEGLFTLDGTDSEDIKQRVAMNIGHINEKRAHDLLFKIMNENINKWWD